MKLDGQMPPRAGRHGREMTNTRHILYVSSGHVYRHSRVSIAVVVLRIIVLNAALRNARFEAVDHNA
jgi:hypothetical protein